MASGNAPTTRRAGGARQGRRPSGRRRPTTAGGPRAEVPPPSAPPPPDLRRRSVAANRRRAASVTFLPAGVAAAALLAAIAAGLPVVGAVIPAVLLLGLAAAAWMLAAPRLAAKLRRLASPPDETADARLYNLVEGVCLASGVPQPELLVMDDPAPNIVAVGRAPEDAVVVCTTGLLALLDRIELEAVVAHEVAHIRGRDIHSGAVSALVLGRLSPVLAARAAGPARETLADQAAMHVTRYPPGLAAALGKLRQAGAAIGVRPAALPGGVARATSHLWLAPLVPAEPRAREPRGALDLDERIALLVEL